MSVAGAISTLTVNVQKSQAIAATDATKVGLCNFNSAQFSVDANGFVSSLNSGIDLHVAKLIVNAAGTSGTGANYTTITAAMAAAVSGDTIFVMPGTYTENVTWKSGVNITAFSCDAQTPNVIFIGTLTCNTAGNRSISGFLLQTNTQVIFDLSAGASVYCIQCYYNCTNQTGASLSGGAGLVFLYCNGNIATTGIAYFNNTSTGGIYFEWCGFANTGGSDVASPSTDGNVYMEYSRLQAPLSMNGAGNFDIHHCQIDCSAVNATALSMAGTGASLARNSNFFSGSATAISIGTGTSLALNNSTINSTNAAAISGDGGLSTAGVVFENSSSVVTVTAQNPRVSFNDAVAVKSPGAYPYTTVPQDAVILVDTSSARTIIPLASPATGQRHVIKDSVGSAPANNITITPSGKNVDNNASTVINLAYGSVTIVFGGTEWHVI